MKGLLMFSVVSGDILVQCIRLDVNKDVADPKPKYRESVGAMGYDGSIKNAQKASEEDWKKETKKECKWTFV